MLKGDLTKFSPGDLLSFLSHMNQEGVLTVSRSDEGLNIYFKNGFIVAAHSEQADGKVLHSLHACQLVSDELFAGLDRARRETGLPLQQILADSGTIDLTEASSTFEAGISEVIFQLFLWETGEFQFNEIPTGDSPSGQIFDCNGMTLDAARRVDEFREFLRTIGSEDLVLVLADLGGQVPECSPETRFVLDHATREKSVRQVMKEGPFTSFAVMKAIEDALDRNWVKLLPSPVSEPTPMVDISAGGKLFLSYKRSTLKVLQSLDKQAQISEILSYCRDHFDYFLLLAFQQDKVVRCRRFQRDENGSLLGAELANFEVNLGSDPTFRFVFESKSPFFGKAFPSPLLKGLGEPVPRGECAILPLGAQGENNFLLFVSSDQEEQIPGPLHFLEMIFWQIHPPGQEDQASSGASNSDSGNSGSEATPETDDPGKTSNADALVAAVNELPPMPHVVSKVMDLLSDADSQMSDMVKVLSSDPALVARLIRVSNSALYGRGQETTSLNQAVVRLGGNTVRSLVMAASMKSLFPLDKTNVGVWGQALWQHSLECGLAARRVAQFSGYSDPEEAFVAGVLHDIGKVVILLNKPDEFRLILKRQAAAKESFATAERAVLGFDHTDVGELLLAKWQMPGNLQVCVKHHHYPSEADQDNPLPYIIAAGNFLSHAFGSQPDPALAAKSGDFELTCSKLNLAPEGIQTLMGEIGSYLEQSGLVD